MKGIIRTGDKTTGGGQVLSGSSLMVFNGIGVARLGDPVYCPKKGHNNVVIAQGHPTFLDNGIPVAFDGHKCSCGCTLISSLPNAKASL
ncbi:PAAR domain-containing protein [Providencia rettgeri]|uniref:PAAR domain-containing protein n=1 Tax=Providencia rettgeri TaxID=587 RepID=A0AAP2JWN8_PRORE|nr:MULTISPECIES: PAAR domain-containing protein [Providencia]EJD6083016.1 PAAR domain-containing protein [Providencia rettgeri]EJD6499488.1 PAAR domain-containing protein [Providencia rettgeri]EJD6600163.1 PAAR domain-containing protein [Providencia rettgeri]EJD6643781.1 PAAR domain-containing protein [Providencia rettgeri]ELL9154392.1 PAAR domain-containing protein [Providencia rettgeri]